MQIPTFAHAGSETRRGRPAWARGILAVEMEAVALDAFARAADRKVLCLAYVTNTMAVAERGFEKGEADGPVDALCVPDLLLPLPDDGGARPVATGMPI